MVDSISTLGLSLSSTKNLSSGQLLLSQLARQLTSGKYSTNLTDYTSSSAQKLLNFNASITQQQGFLKVIETISPRMDIYNSAMEGISDTVAEAINSLTSAFTYNEDTNASLASSLQGMMDQVAYYLNQEVGGRYIFSGSRYDRAPVGDITALPVPPTETAPYLATGNTVPAYDRDYDPLDITAEVPEANVRESVMIDTTKDLIYGVTSNEDGFQQVIMGLRWAYAATQDETNYEAYMETAKDLLRTGLANVRATHTDSTNAYTTLRNAGASIEAKVINLKDQVDNIESVDLNEVAVKITTLQAQLQASYSAVSNLINLTILDYL